MLSLAIPDGQPPPPLKHPFLGLLVGCVDEDSFQSGTSNSNMLVSYHRYTTTVTHTQQVVDLILNVRTVSTSRNENQAKKPKPVPVKLSSGQVGASVWFQLKRPNMEGIAWVYH